MVLCIILLVFVGVFVFYKLSYSGEGSSSSTSSSLKTDTFTSDRDPEFMKWNIEHDADIFGYSIAGINFRQLDYTFIGPFEGTVRIEPDNQYDQYAVAIYRGRKKVGYIPKKDSRYVHDKIIEQGEKVNCIGYIYTFMSDDYTDKFAGMVIPDLKIEPRTTVISPLQNSDT